MRVSSGKENFSQGTNIGFLQPITELVDFSQQPSMNTIVIESTAGLICDQRRTLLYNVQQPFKVPIKEFDEEWWPLVTNIWVKYIVVIKTLLMEIPKKPSYAALINPLNQQRVHVEWFQDSPDHAHELDESDKLKCSQAVRVLVEKEAVKNYPAPAIHQQIYNSVILHKILQTII
ncbi:hypothetical protein C2G38_2169988 [Gigaspora rosea]|uniref:Uncharacterized protein n=1 Tax=Gigaspora rosea TaxID=44941 RepID=A0A397VRG2_9GLOM|nr:hypothetical protein C2G38_2169988 [Gigaspora rosea]